MAFNFFVRKKDIQEQVEPQKNSLIDADLLLIQIGLMQQTYFSLAIERDPVQCDFFCSVLAHAPHLIPLSRLLNLR